MASTYTTGFGIEKIGTGEQAGAWGTTTNHNADILDRIASYKAVALSGTTHTLTVREASPGSGTENLQDGMYRVIKFTGALGANNTVTIAPNTSPAYFIIENATTDSGSSGPYSVILTQGSGANVTVQNGKNAIIYCDGAGSGAVVYDALADLQVGTLEVTGAAAIDGALTQGGASQFNSTITVGVNDTGYDVKLFGAASGSYLLWDESADDLILAGAAGLSVAGGSALAALTTSGIVSVDDTTDSTSGTSGSIHTDGGVGIAKDLFVGGDIIVAAGSAASPSVALVSNTNTGMYKVGTNRIGFTTAGSHAMGIGSGSNGGDVDIANDLDVTGVATAATFEPDGDTSAADNAAIGYTAAEGFILTGQGSTNDITVKNDADVEVIGIPTGTTEVQISTTTAGTGANAKNKITLQGITENSIPNGLIQWVSVDDGESGNRWGLYTNAVTSGDFILGYAASGTFASVVEFQTSKDAWFKGAISVDDTTDSTSGTSGSIHTDGGVGIAKDLFVGGDITIGAAGAAATLSTASAGTNNLTLGVNAGNSIVSGGNFNVAIGDEAGTAISNGDSNVAIGYTALDGHTTASFNVAIGHGSIGNGTANGHTNTAAGYLSARDLTSGYNNVCIGGYSGIQLTSAIGCTFLGESSGYGAVTGNYNVGVGKNALYVLTSGTNNTAVGTFALTGNIGASNNTAVGYYAMGVNQTGTFNVAVGAYALDAVVTTSQNTAVGYAALSACTGNGNTAVGDQAMLVAGAASYNVAIGDHAGDSITTGDGNHCLGYYAGATIAGGDYNICVGYQADTGATNSNVIVIGHAIAPTTDNQFTFGKASNVVQNEFDTDAAWTRTSDVRKKRNIKDDELGLEFINNLRTVTHQWKPSNEFPEEWDEYNDENTMNLDATMHGMIAQEVKEALDKSGCDTFGGWKEREDGSQTVSREMFVTPLIKAVQELSAEINELKKWKEEHICG